jgi:hypothetical protein
MPDSYGKRQRREVKAKKAVAREERRAARKQRSEDRAAGVVEEAPLETPQLDDPGDIVVNEYGVVVSTRGDDSADPGGR